MKRTILLLLSHLAAVGAGFVLGIYLLPILTAPPAPTVDAVQAMAAESRLSGEFRRDLADSDALHWGEGKVSISRDSIVLEGRLAPGPDYKLYLSPQFLETEADFERLKGSMVRVGDIRTFDNFIVDVPPDIDPTEFNTVIVWCESFGQFITAAQYQ